MSTELPPGPWVVDDRHRSGNERASYRMIHDADGNEVCAVFGDAETSAAIAAHIVATPPPPPVDELAVRVQAALAADPDFAHEWGSKYASIISTASWILRHPINTDPAALIVNVPPPFLDLINANFGRVPIECFETFGDIPDTTVVTVYQYSPDTPPWLDNGHVTAADDDDLPDEDVLADLAELADEDAPVDDRRSGVVATVNLTGPRGAVTGCWRQRIVLDQTGETVDLCDHEHYDMESADDCEDARADRSRYQWRSFR